MQWLRAALVLSARSFASGEIQAMIQVTVGHVKAKQADVVEARPWTCSTYLRFGCLGKTNLTIADVAYPCCSKPMQKAAETSDAVSVRSFSQVPGNWAGLKRAISPIKPPTQVEWGAAFWQEFDQITKLQADRRNGTMAASKMLLPQMFENKSMEDGAMAVEKDFPSKYPTKLVEQFLKEDVEFDANIVPHYTMDDFVNKQVMLSRVIGWAVSVVSPTAFAAKWRRGRPRPEEVAKAIIDRDPRVAGAPSDVVARVEALNLTQTGATDYTAYTNGSPKHPSWPAMHSAASTASVYLPVVLNLNASQLLEAQRLDCAVATFRSFAGVHYESDNMAGLAIGQEVIRAELPKMLQNQYKSNALAVKKKLKQVIDAHDWRTAPSCLLSR